MEAGSRRSSSPEKHPLAELSPNTTSPQRASNQDTALKDLNFRPEILKNENSNQQQQQLLQLQQEGEKQTYISPSDQIMSPTTKKLNEIKGRRFVSAKPQSLFAKALGGKQALRSEEKLSGGSADAEQVEK
jgi:hypothetical protein